MRLTHLAPLTTAALLLACAPARSPYFDTVTVLSATGVTNGVPAFKLRTAVLRGNFGLVWCGTNPVAVTSNRFITGIGAEMGAPAKRDDLVAAGWLTFFEADRAYDVADLDQPLFERTMAWKRPSSARIEAIRVSGVFSRLVSQEKGEECDVPGVLCGFYVPPYLQSLEAPTPYRWWFEDGRGAGLLQVKEFALKVGRIELDECDDLQVRLPPTIQ